MTVFHSFWPRLTLALMTALLLGQTTPTFAQDKKNPEKKETPKKEASKKTAKKTTKKTTKKASKTPSKKPSTKKTTKKTTKKSAKKSPSKAKSKSSTGPWFSPNGGANDAIAATIDKAKKTVDIAIYSISTDGPIIKALRRAKKRKVVIRMVLHKATSSNLAGAKFFAKLGVKVYGVGPTMHHKFAIIDGKTLLNGSGNWSSAANSKFNEVLMRFKESPTMLKEFQKEFRYLIQKSRKVTSSGKVSDKKDTSNLKIPSRSRGSNVYFTSHNSKESYVAADQIIKAMKGAKKSIYIMVAHFNSDRITKALVKILKAQKKAKKKIVVRVLLDRAEFDDKKSQSKELEKAGADVRYKVYSLGFYFPRAQLMHHKTIIVDDTVLVTGSYNWSDTAEHTNYENVIVLNAKKKNAEQSRIIKAFAKEYDRLWDFNRKHIAAFSKAVLSKKGQKGYRTVVPIHFDRPYWNKVMVMTRKELTPIMAVAAKAGLKGNESQSYLSKNTGKALKAVRGQLCPPPKAKKSKKKTSKKSTKKTPKKPTKKPAKKPAKKTPSKEPKSPAKKSTKKSSPKKAPSKEKDDPKSKKAPL